jgi:hypothetical protein
MMGAAKSYHDLSYLYHRRAGSAQAGIQANECSPQAYVGRVKMDSRLHGNDILKAFRVHDILKALRGHENLFVDPFIICLKI